MFSGGEVPVPFLAFSYSSSSLDSFSGVPRRRFEERQLSIHFCATEMPSVHFPIVHTQQHTPQRLPCDTIFVWFHPAHVCSDHSLADAVQHGSAVTSRHIRPQTHLHQPRTSKLQSKLFMPTTAGFDAVRLHDTWAQRFRHIRKSPAPKTRCVLATTARSS